MQENVFLKNRRYVMQARVKGAHGQECGRPSLGSSLLLKALLQLRLGAVWLGTAISCPAQRKEPGRNYGSF
jgi:hypothetical protein